MNADSYINRELSWLEFNRRVLEEARQETVPLLERVKFLAIFSSNLDEFFMVRVARLKQLAASGEASEDPDGMSPAETLNAISRRVHELAAEQHICFLNTILPELTREGIHLVRPEEMSSEQARFDEEANITWARALEKVGAHVVYGLVGFKTHCKVCLVVRQEADGIRRYCHLATGNYNARTAGIYSDFGLFTCVETFGQDLTELFNLLTGYTRPQRFNHLILAPVGLREHFLTCIRQEAEHARAGRPARIIVKVNSLIDPAIIEELYLAGQAGVEIDLLVRGMCSLKPGVPGLSERIRVVSVIDRYLEHARIFFFHNDGSASVFLASADWMQRNFDRRVEIAFPVLDEQHQARLKEILEIQLSDNVKGWQVHADGSSTRIASPDAHSSRSQEQLYEVMRHDYSGPTAPPPAR